jgi:hypothetical protein
MPIGPTQTRESMILSSRVQRPEAGSRYRTRETEGDIICAYVVATPTLRAWLARRNLRADARGYPELRQAWDLRNEPVRGPATYGPRYYPFAVICPISSPSKEITTTPSISRKSAMGQHRESVVGSIFLRTRTRSFATYRSPHSSTTVGVCKVIRPPRGRILFYPRTQ